MDGTKNREIENGIISKVIGIVCTCTNENKLRDISFTILSYIVRLYTDTETLISYFNKFDIYNLIIQTFQQIIKNPNASSTTSEEQVDAVIHLLLSLSSNAQTAEGLLSHKIVYLFNDHSTFIYKQNYLTPYHPTSKNRNIYHRIWCKIIQVLIEMSETLSNSETFKEQFIQFISVNESVLFDKWNDVYQLSASNLPPVSQVSLSIGKLEEFQLVTKLFYRWVCLLEDWQLNLFKQLPNVRSNILLALQFFIITLLKPELFKYIQPISKLEVQQSQSSGNEFNNRIEPLIHTVIGNCLSFVRRITPKVWKFNFEEGDIVLLFSPHLEQPNFPQRQPSFGCLLSSIRIYSRMYDPKFIANLDVNHLSGLLGLNLQNTLAIILLQLSLYLYKYSDDRSKFDLYSKVGGELIDFLDKLHDKIPSPNKPEPTAEFVAFTSRTIKSLFGLNVSKIK